MNILSSVISSSILSLSAVDDPVHEVPESDATERLTLSLCQLLVVHSYLRALEYLVNCFCECPLKVGADICQVPGFITKSSRVSLRLCPIVPYGASFIM